MLKILINAYACSPNMGSEPGMGWNWVLAIARHCEVYVITEGEFQKQIEAALETSELKGKFHFFYNPVTEKVRRMCWNQGDWRFYWYYWKWQRKTANIARDICRQHHIDIIHQLNMIGFREPGCLFDVAKDFNIPIVWGPIGGLKQFPLKYANNWKMKVFLYIKNKLNILQLKYYPRIRHALNNADVLISSIPDSYHAIKQYAGLDSVIIPETGCNTYTYNPDRSFDERRLNIVWAGKFDYRKRIDIAIKAIAQSDNPQICLHIYGTGNEEQVKEVTSLIKSLHIDNQVTLHGNTSHDDVERAMLSAHLFFFTSVSEDTSTVVLEAISNGLPVLCFDTCGMSAVIDDTVGRKIPLSTPELSIKDFANDLNYFYQNKNELKNLSDNCRQKSSELSWKNKGNIIMNIYKQLTEQKI